MVADISPAGCDFQLTEPDYELVTKNELPAWYSKERYLLTGYRRCRSVSSCAKSIFKVHNQSVNIWLHLPISFLLLPYFAYVFKQLPESNSDWDTTVVYLSVVFGNVSTLFLSGICHTFFCLSQRVHNICWFMDFVGLLTGILGGGVGVGYFSFKCHHEYLIAYFVLMACMYPLMIVVTWRRYWAHVGTLPLDPDYSFPEFVAPLGVFNLFSWIMVLAIDKIAFSEYTREPAFVLTWNLSAACPVILIVGALIQYFNFPDKFVKPGTVDIVGSSHQLWHLCGMSLMFVWIHAITSHYQARQDLPCSQGSPKVFFTCEIQKMIHKKSVLEKKK